MKKSLLLLAALGLAPSLALAKDPGTGVAPNGDALVSSPAFAADGVPVDMFNVVRAETAKLGMRKLSIVILCGRSGLN